MAYEPKTMLIAFKWFWTFELLGRNFGILSMIYWKLEAGDGDIIFIGVDYDAVWNIKCTFRDKLIAMLCDIETRPFFQEREVNGGKEQGSIGTTSPIKLCEVRTTKGNNRK